MTESEWQTCTDPQQMLEFLRGKASERKFRLLAVGCCQRVWHLLHGQTWRKAVGVAKRLPDGAVSGEEHDAVFSKVCHEYEQFGVDPFYEEYGDYGEKPDSEQAKQAEQAHAALAIVCALGRVDVDDAASHAGKGCPYDPTSLAAKAAARAVAYAAARTVANPSKTWEEVRKKETIAQTVLLREIFGNPFQPVVGIDPSWLKWQRGRIVKLAQRIYDQCQFEEMPALANALEQAGCTAVVLLAHCREPGEHVRGCWLIDALLGKE